LREMARLDAPRTSFAGRAGGLTAFRQVLGSIWKKARERGFSARNLEHQSGTLEGISSSLKSGSI
jgi:hypothetical protein